MKMVALLALLLAGSCLNRPTGGVGDRERDERHLRELEAEARALANPAGCTASGQCSTAPVGARACGGPQDYLVFCPLTTDTAAMHRKLRELAEAQQAFNRKHQIVSTCEFRSPPSVELVDGRCRAATR